MLQMPDPTKSWDYENGFYLTCNVTRISKIVAHWELYKSVQGLVGHVAEFGVFKGASLVRFATFRHLSGGPWSKKIIGFDTFGTFPESIHGPDAAARQEFVEAAGDQSITVPQLTQVLERASLGENIELVEGDICETLPRYLEQHPELRLSLINLDTDVYEPAKVILEHLYPRLVPGGVLILDDYGTWPGESDAVDEYFAGQSPRIEKFPFAMTPCFIRKP